MAGEKEDTARPWPPQSNAPFLAYSKVHINAPAALVYELLTSPSTWPDWNAFVPTAHLLSRAGADADGSGSSSSSKREDYIYTTESGVGDAKYRSTPRFRVGDILRYNVQLPMAGKGAAARRTKSASDERIIELTVPTAGGEGEGEGEGKVGKGAVYRAVWDVVEKFGMPNGVRQNEVEALGDGECEYRSWEEMTGLMAYAVKLAVGAAVQRGFEEWAEGLKAEAEKRYSAQKQ